MCVKGCTATLRNQKARRMKCTNHSSRNATFVLAPTINLQNPGDSKKRPPQNSVPTQLCRCFCCLTWRRNVEVFVFEVAVSPFLRNTRSTFCLVLQVLGIRSLSATIEWWRRWEYDCTGRETEQLDGEVAGERDDTFFVGTDHRASIVWCNIFS